jgi:hypothetical protein
MLRLGVIASLLCVGSLSVVGQCSSRTQVEHVDRHAYEQLQQFVNEGHEPWRLDSQAVAASEVLTLEKVPKEQWDVYTVHLTAIQETETRSVYEYESRSQHGLSYRITVERFEWLLPAAKKWQWMVWAPAQVTITNCKQA